MKARTWIVLACVLPIVAAAAGAELRFANLFNDSMVLQREKPLTVWGWAEPGAKVTVVLTENRAEAVALAGEKAFVREQPEPAKKPVEEKPGPRVRVVYEQENYPAFKAVKKTATADEAGLWKVTIEPPAASFAPKFLAAASAGGEGAAVGDVLVGEVWLCAGQSNMFYGGNRTAWLDNKGMLLPGVRYAHTGRAASHKPLDDLGERVAWTVCVEENMKDISTIPYLFGKFLHRQLQVPVGVINAASGGAQGNYWCSLDELHKVDRGPVKEMMDAQDAAVAEWENPARRKLVLDAYEKEYAAAKAQWEKDAAAAKAEKKRPPAEPQYKPPQRPQSKSLASFLYNARIAPSGRFAIRGFLYLQGEQQVLTWTISQYADTFPAVLRSFRAAFGDEQLPFGIITLQGAAHTKGSHTELDSVDRTSIVREIHYKTHLATPNTGFICAHDVGLGLHPSWKRPVAERAVFWACRDVYKTVDNAHMSVKEVVFEDGKAKVHLQREKAVRRKDSKTKETTLTYQKTPAKFAPYSSGDTFPLTGFAIAGADKRWYPGKIHIPTGQPGVLEVWNPLVSEPVAIRYGWGSYAHANLGDWNDPLPPFRTDDWVLVGGPKDKVPADKTPRDVWYTAVHAAYDDQLDRQIRQGSFEAAVCELKLYADAAKVLQSKAGRIEAILDELDPAIFGGDMAKYVDRRNWLNVREDEARLRSAAKVLDQLGELAKAAEVRKQLDAIRAAAEKLPAAARSKAP